MVLFFGEVRFAHALSSFGIGDITANVISFVAQGVGYIIGFIGGVFLTIAGYLIQLALNINFEILKSPVVQTGWKIVLGFANLGFVLAIIVMAFATIFRVQSYAMKQTLWKLIVAALLVNFSLVIAGAFINISDIFSNYFLQQGGIRNPVEWAKSFAGMFRAQALLKVSETMSAQGVVDTATGVVNTFGSTVLQTIASVFFVALFTILAAITLFAVVIMLLIRYVYLGILLLLSPIIWLLWIFPSTKHLWTKWWQQFLRWTFFAPIMLFFIYLAMYSMQYAPDSVRQFTRNPQATANVSLTFGVEVIGEMAIVIALVMGGLIAANSLGIEFSKTAYDWAQKSGKGFGRWVGRNTLEATGGRFFASKLLRGDVATGKKGLVERLSASKIPGVRFVGRGLNRLGETTEKTLQAGYAKGAKGLTPDRLNYEIQNSRGSRRAVLMQEAAKRKNIDMKILGSIINDPQKMEGIQKNFINSGLDFKDIEKAIGRSFEMIGAKTAGDLRATTEKFVKSQAPKDWAKGQWNDVFSKTTDQGLENIQKELARAFAGLGEHGHGAYAKIMPSIKGRNMEDFKKIMREGMTEVRKTDQQMAKDAEDRFVKTLGRRAELGEEAFATVTTA